MRRRSFLSAAGLGALGLTAAACGSSTTTSSGSGGSSSSSSAAATGAPALEGTGPFTFVQGKDNSGFIPKQVAAWNKANPSETCKLIELDPSADAQRQSMVQNATIKSDAYGVLNLDVVWTAEFAANQWITQLDAADFPAANYLPATSSTGTYFNKLYAAPSGSDGALLYYRKDLLDAAGVSEVPTTWAGVVAAIDKVKSKNPSIGGYLGQFQKYEGLTCNFSEVVNSSGGSVLDDKNQPTVDTDAAKAGLHFLVDGFKQGYIPKAAITYKEEESRNAFQSGGAVFLRNWPYAYSLMGATDGSSKVAGKFGIAQLPGKDGPGVSTLGGHNLAISTYAKNKASCLKFIKFLSSEEQQRLNVINTSSAPTLGKLYDDPALVKKYPYLPVLKKSIQGARKRPAAVKYNDVTTALQTAAYTAMQGSVSVDDALSKLQTDLTGFLKA